MLQFYGDKVHPENSSISIMYMSYVTQKWIDLVVVDKTV